MNGSMPVTPQPSVLNPPGMPRIVRATKFGAAGDDMKRR